MSKRLKRGAEPTRRAMMLGRHHNVAQSKKSADHSQNREKNQWASHDRRRFMRVMGGFGSFLAEKCYEYQSRHVKRGQDRDDHGNRKQSERRSFKRRPENCVFAIKTTQRRNSHQGEGAK